MGKRDAGQGLGRNGRRDEGEFRGDRNARDSRDEAGLARLHRHHHEEGDSGACAQQDCRSDHMRPAQEHLDLHQVSGKGEGSWPAGRENIIRLL